MKDTLPVAGYILPLWNQKGQYRATAHAYMKRENVQVVENLNGKKYTLEQIEKGINRINYT
jgi:hypothetical protein